MEGDTPNFALRNKKKSATAEVGAVTASAPEDQEKTAESVSQLPKPSGFKLLIMLPKADETTDGGIVLAEQTRKREEVGSITGFVLEMGPDAYTDKKRFPSGPYCKKGDWIMMRAYSGTRFTIHGEEFRLINDDSVDAVVDDPRGIAKT